MAKMQNIPPNKNTWMNIEKSFSVEKKDTSSYKSCEENKKKLRELKVPKNYNPLYKTPAKDGDHY